MMMLKDEQRARSMRGREVARHGLALVGPELEDALSALVREFKIGFAIHRDDQTFSEAIARQAPDLVVIDSDIMGHPCDIGDLARRHNPKASVIVVACFWSEREEALRDCADAVVHKPVRRSEWCRAFAAFGVPTRSNATQKAAG